MYAVLNGYSDNMWFDVQIHIHSIGYSGIVIGYA